MLAAEVNRVNFRTRMPKRQGGRRTMLYRRYEDMRSRVQGRATKAPWHYEGLALAWATFAEFRAWALANGFSKENNSPERKDPTKGYTPDNVVFVAPGVNHSTSRGRRYYSKSFEQFLQSDEYVRGPQPPVDDDVPF